MQRPFLCSSGRTFVGSFWGSCVGSFLGSWGSAFGSSSGDGAHCVPPRGTPAGACPRSVPAAKPQERAPLSSSARKQELPRPGHICAGNSFSGVPCPVFSLHTKSRPAALRLRTACRPGRRSIYPAVPRSAGPGSGYRFLSAPWWAWNNSF